MTAWRVLRAAGGLAAFSLLALPWALLPRRGNLARRLERLGWRLLLRGLAIRVVVHGAGEAAASGLIVANHVSWTDIAVLAARFDTAFVAKSEVGRWPLIGPLARRHGCRFIDRGSRKAAHGLAARMADGHHRPLTTLFAEGTTGDGSALLPFRTSLFQPFAHGPGAVQPVTIIYRARGGRALDDGERRRIAWLGDDPLLPHVLSLARFGGLMAEVWIEQQASGSDRKALAASAHGLIAARIAGRNAQAAALKRVT